MEIREYLVQFYTTSTTVLFFFFQHVEEQDEGRGLSREFPSLGTSGSLSHQDRGIGGGL